MQTFLSTNRLRKFLKILRKKKKKRRLTPREFMKVTSGVERKKRTSGVLSTKMLADGEKKKPENPRERFWYKKEKGLSF